MTNPPSDMPAPFAIFRARDARDYGPDGPMSPAVPSPIEAQGGRELAEAGALEGSRIKLLYSRPGFSLTHVWFRSGFPLPRHSHDAECLYVIVGGDLRIGTEQLGPGDGFFVGRDVPYTYVPGPSGVEVLEIRTSDAFDIKLHANNAAWWAKAAARLVDHQPGWADEAPPSGWSIG